MNTYSTVTPLDYNSPSRMIGVTHWKKKYKHPVVSCWNCSSSASVSFYICTAAVTS